jgi:hypothetical protein
MFIQHMQPTGYYDHLSRIYFDIYADTVLGKRLEINFAGITLAIGNLNVLIEEQEQLPQPTTIYYMLGYKLYHLQSSIERLLQAQKRVP